MTIHCLFFKKNPLGLLGSCEETLTRLLVSWRDGRVDGQAVHLREHGVQLPDTLGEAGRPGLQDVAGLEFVDPIVPNGAD